MSTSLQKSGGVEIWSLNTTWYWEELRPDWMLRNKGTSLGYILLNSRKIPRRDIGCPLGSSFQYWGVGSSTYTGHPQV